MGTEERMVALKERAITLKSKRESAKEAVIELEKTIHDLEKNVSDVGKVLKVLGKLADRMVKKDLDVINHLVNYGLKVVFPDRDLQFRASMTEVNSKMQVDFETFDSGKLSSNDTHGSVSVVESLILRIICVAKSGVAKLLLLDETFSAIDGDYVVRVGVLLKELAEKMKMDVLLATFNAAAPSADTILRATLNKKVNELQLSEHKGE